MKATARVLAVLSLSSACLLGAGAPAGACSGTAPLMGNARFAEYIVVGTVMSVGAGGEALIIDVERTIKGNVPSTIHPTRIRAGICGGGVRGVQRNDHVIYARHFTQNGYQYDAFWSFDSNGDLISTSAARWNDRVYTFDSVLAVLQGLPATDVIEEPGQAMERTAAVVVFMSAAAMAWLIGPRKRRARLS